MTEFYATLFKTLHIGTRLLHPIFAFLCTSHTCCYVKVQWFSNVSTNESGGLYFERCIITLQRTYIREHLEDTCSALNIALTITGEFILHLQYN